MRRQWAVSVWVSVLGAVCAGACAAEGDAGSRFARQAFLSHIEYLASDELAGRGLGTEGIAKAAAYIAEQFEAGGVRPAGEDGGYFQSFELTLRRELTDDVRLTIGGRRLEFGKEVVVTHMSSDGAFDGPVAFVGYGITAEEHKYDDYASVDPTGKVLLLLRYEPPADDPEASFGGRQHSEHAYFRTKIALAKEKGAVAVLMVNPPLDEDQEDDLDELAFDGSGGRRAFGLPFLHVTREAADRLVRAGGLDSLEALQKRIDSERKGFAADLAGMTAKGNAGIRTVKGKVRNIIGLVPGHGELADEFLVIGAHYDHLGFAPSSFRRRDNTKHIHNGADDNASGTAGLIELGRRFVAERASLKRSVLLIAFTAEETGLLGSKHFVEHPTIALDKVAVMINLDMIGRLRDDKLQVFGTKTGDGLGELVVEVAEPFGFELALTGSGIGPSDHTSFYHKEIPVLHFCTGTHRDYHRPSDDTELVNVAGGVRVIELVYRTARAILDRPERFAYQVTKSERSGGRPRAKVRLGVMPSYSEDDEKGMRLDGVAADSPAERAGLESGDRIIKLGTHPVGDVYDLMNAISKLEPGQTVPVVVVRDKKEITLSITPEAP